MAKASLCLAILFIGASAFFLGFDVWIWTTGIALFAQLFVAWKIKAGTKRRMASKWWSRKPPTIERANTDNLGHAELMDPKALRRLLPATSGKLIGANPDGLLFDGCHNTSGISLEFIGTRGGKSSRACTMIAYWPGSLMVFDPAQELAHMTRRLLTAQYKHVYILSPDTTDHAAAQTNVLGWIDTGDPLAEVHVHTIAGLFFDEEGVQKTQGGQFFAGTAASMLACILAHVLWSADQPEEISRVPPMPADLISVRQFLSLKPDDLRMALQYIHGHSRSMLARRYAGPLIGAHPETFTDIHNTCALATRWLTMDVLADMICGDTFEVADISHDPRLAVFVQIPTNICLDFPSFPNVLFGSFLAAKMAQPGDTFPLVVVDESSMLKAQAVRQTVLYGGKYRMAMHMFWQSIGDLDRIWGRDTRKSFMDSAAWVAFGPMGDIQAAQEVSEACGTFGAIAYSKGDNTSTQAGTGWWARWSRGRNLSQHPVKRSVFFPAELIQDLHRGVRLILWRERPPAVVAAAPYFDVRELDGLIDPSPYDRPQAPPEPWWRISLRRHELPVRIA